MKVAVFGATGGTGRATVRRLLEEGHHVTAFARTPDALGIHDERLRIVQGNVIDPQAVRRAVTGQNAIIVAIGVSTRPLYARIGIASKTPKDLCETGTCHVITAMRQEGVRRLTCVSAWGVGDARNRVPWFFRLFRALLLEERYADKERQEEAVRGSGLDWTIIRPVGLSNGPASGAYAVRLDGAMRKFIIARADVAAFICRSLSDERYFEQIVTLSG